MTFSTRTVLLYQSLLIAIFLNTFPSFGSGLDSLRTEEVGGKLFIIHQVDPGETLYALSRRYKVSVPDIITYNESAKLDLAVGVIIRIPLANPSVKIDTVEFVRHKVKPKETLFSLSRQYSVSLADLRSINNLVSNKLNIGQVLYIKPNEVSTESVKVEVPISSDEITHQLQQGETLYSLSKQYDVSLDQLREWNDLEENNLSIGQLLVVGLKESAIQDNQTITDIEPEKLKNIKVTSSDSDTTLTIKQVKNINGFDEIVETGIGEMIPGSTETHKYLGLHRTAKVGTIVKVRNEMNDKIVFVRIIGKIPNTGGNKKVLIKITKVAYDRLGIIDPRFRVEISYMP